MAKGLTPFNQTLTELTTVTAAQEAIAWKETEGPEPAPLLPRYDLLVLENGGRVVGSGEEHCNWLQRAENSVDQSHLIALHGPENKEGVKMKNQPFKIGVCALPVFLFVISCAPSIFEAGREIMSGRDALLQDF